MDKILQDLADGQLIGVVTDCKGGRNLFDYELIDGNPYFTESRIDDKPCRKIEITFAFDQLKLESFSYKDPHLNPLHETKTLKQ